MIQAANRAADDQRDDDFKGVRKENDQAAPEEVAPVATEVRKQRAELV